MRNDDTQISMLLRKNYIKDQTDLINNGNKKSR